MAKRKHDQEFLERFVVTWESCFSLACFSLADVAEKMGMTSQSAAQLASVLRKGDVPLKSMRGSSLVDYDRLRALVDERAGKRRRVARREPTPSEALDRDHH